jgi:3-hydroxyacyl-[acyl-carrier-protein] dehydratase
MIRRRGVLNLAQIKQRIPHRHPFLFLDRVISLEAGKRGVGLKCVSGNEEVFNGHFPDEPIFPGALIIESAAQMAAITLMGEQEAPVAQGMLLSVESFRFLHPVVPGDTMIVETRILKTLGPLVKVSAEVKVEELVVARGELALLRRRAR